MSRNLPTNAGSLEAQDEQINAQGEEIQDLRAKVRSLQLGDERGTDAPNDEDGRDLRLSAADRSATEFYAAMIAPSGARPSVTKRQIAIKSLRAKAIL